MATQAMRRRGKSSKSRPHDTDYITRSIIRPWASLVQRSKRLESCKQLHSQSLIRATVKTHAVEQAVVVSSPVIHQSAVMTSVKHNRPVVRSEYSGNTFDTPAVGYGDSQFSYVATEHTTPLIRTAGPASVTAATQRYARADLSAPMHVHCTATVTPAIVFTSADVRGEENVRVGHDLQPRQPRSGYVEMTQSMSSVFSTPEPSRRAGRSRRRSISTEDGSPTCSPAPLPPATLTMVAKSPSITDLVKQKCRQLRRRLSSVSIGKRSTYKMATGCRDDDKGVILKLFRRTPTSSPSHSKCKSSISLSDLSHNRYLSFGGGGGGGGSASSKDRLHPHVIREQENTEQEYRLPPASLDYVSPLNPGGAPDCNECSVRLRDAYKFNVRLKHD